VAPIVTRSYDRPADGLRPVTIEPGFVRTASGSALISMGETRVICTASAETGVPRWRAGSGLGSRRPGEGTYSFLCTGDVDAFRALGTRFLQMPLTEVEHVGLTPAPTAEVI
jgi:hypothetical protein